MSTVNHIGAPKGLSPAKLYSTEVKAQQIKASQAGGNELAVWLEEAKAYVSGIRAGTVSQDPNDYSLMQYDQWIAQVEAQIFGVGGGMAWDPTAGTGVPAASTPQAPPGAIVGADGSFVFDGKSAEVVYDGNPTLSNVNSEKVTMAVNSMGARYSFSMVSDGVTGEEVLKVVIDGPQGQQTYVFNNVHDADFHLDLFAANPENVNLDGLPDEIKSKITVGDIEELSTELANPQASVNGNPIEGEPVEGEANAFKYEASTVTEIIDFYPVAGENETHYVTGNTTINIPLSSSASVAPLMDGSKPGYNYVVVVTHEDGSSTDTFYLKGESFNHHINGLPENINFITGANADGSPIVETGKVPSGYQDDFTIYGVEGGGAFPGDSAPDKTADLNGIPVNTYNTAADVTLHVGGPTTTTWNDIFATGNVNLSTQTNQDVVFIDRLADGTVQINITRANDGITETFFVHPGTSGLPTINITGNNITYGPGFSGPDEAAGLAAIATLGKINVNGANAAEGLVAAVTGNIPDNMQAVMNLLGLSGQDGLEQMRVAFSEAFGSEYTIEEVIAAFNDAKQNNEVTQNFLRAMYLLDPTISDAYRTFNDLSGADDSEGTHDDWVEASEDMVARLTEIIGATCPTMPASLYGEAEAGRFKFGDNEWLFHTMFRDFYSND